MDLMATPSVAGNGLPAQRARYDETARKTVSNVAAPGSAENSAENASPETRANAPPDTSLLARRFSGSLVVDADGLYSPAPAGTFSAISVYREEASLLFEFASAGGTGSVSMQFMRETVIHEQAASGFAPLVGPGASSPVFAVPFMPDESVDLLESLDEPVKGKLLEMLNMIKMLSKDPERLERHLEKIFGAMDMFGASQTTVSVEVVQVRFFFGEGAQPPPEGLGDPLVLDVDGDGIELSGVDSGVMFDLDADGAAERVSFPTGGDAFLAIDRDGDGLITSGRELFGDAGGSAHGFADLAALDENYDAVISAEDSVFGDILVFTNADSDGVGTPDELQTLDEAGIESISIGRTFAPQSTQSGDMLAGLGFFKTTGGELNRVAEMLLRFRPADA